jgi:hypothetical protein
MNGNCNNYGRFTTRINVNRYFVIDYQNNINIIRTSIIIDANHFVILICVLCSRETARHRKGLKLE